LKHDFHFAQLNFKKYKYISDYGPEFSLSSINFFPRLSYFLLKSVFKFSPAYFNLPHISMAAPQIPNLLSMRGRGGGRGGRGRGRGGSTISAHEFANEFIPERYEAEVLRDRVIRETDTDAAVSRRAAVTAGYLDDKYAYEFATNKTPCRRLPIINRGKSIQKYVLTPANRRRNLCPHSCPGQNHRIIHQDQ
jgi:hypothetical protein